MVALIDLGEVRDEPVPEPPAGRARAATRPYRVLAVLLATLVTLAGAAPRPERSVVVLPARLGTDTFLIGNRLYVVDPPPDPGGNAGRQLVAYRIRSHGPPAELWRTTLEAGDRIQIREQGGRLLVTGLTDGDPGDAYRTVMVDARTGQPGWQQPGYAVLAGDGVLVMTADRTGRGSIRRLDPASGRTRWSLPVAPGGLELRSGPDGAGGPHGPDDVDRILLFGASGEVQVFDAGTGTRLAARTFHLRIPADRQLFHLAGDLLLVLTDGGTIAAYGLDRLDDRWTGRLASVDFLAPCGDLVCAYQHNGGVWALDPATGAVRWSDPRWQAVLRVDGGRFLAAVPDGSDQSALAVVDAATGRQVAALGRWDLVDGNQRGDRLLGVRPGRDGRLLVAELDVAVGRARLVDVLPGVVGACQIARDVLLCRRSDGGIGLWRLP